MKDSGEIDPSWKEHDWNKTDHERKIKITLPVPFLPVSGKPT